MLNVLDDGRFELTIESAQLSRGLRPSKRVPRNSGYLVECQGMVGLDGVLQAIEELTRLDTSAIDTAFPFPQIFVFTRCIIVCNQTTIYEWDGASLVSKLTSLTAGLAWSAVDLFDYVYLTNGQQAVVRSAATKEYSISSSLPYGTTLCNFNGQILIGAANCASSVVDLVESVIGLAANVTVDGDGLVGSVLEDTLNTTIAIRGDVGSG